MVWAVSKLGEVCNIVGGGTPTKSNEDFYGGEIPWATVRDMREELLSSTELKITEEAIKKSSTNLIPSGSIITATRVGLGKVCILQQDTAINQDLKAIIPNVGILDNGFLYWWLKSVSHEIVTAGTGATVQGVKLTFIKLLEIPLPPIAEQKRIVAILDKAFADIDRARAITEQNLKNARELFDSYLQQVFSQRGEGWNDERLESICTFSSGGTPSKKNSSYWSGNIPWVSGRDMKSAQLFDSLLHISQSAINEASARMAKAGTILVLVRGMGLAHGAQVAELMVPCAFNQDIKGIHPKPNIVSRYLAITLRYHINISENIISSAAHGTLKINMDDLNNVIIPVPPTVQQKHLVDKFGVFIKEINYLETVYLKKLDALDELKKSILQKAFSGELTKDDTGAAA
mgnify:CR=1 FL=1